MSSNNNGSNKHLVPKVKEGLNRFKTEVAPEVGIQNYEITDKGNHSLKQNFSTKSKRKFEQIKY